MPQQNPFMNFNFGTSINGQPNYDVGMTVDPGMAQQAQQFRQGVGGSGSFGYNFGGGAGNQAEAALQQVDQDQLMSEQMNRLLASDSPYLARARQEGQNAASRRGLMNSSIMAGASMGSAIDRASPIAQFDASRYGDVANRNQAEQNQTNRQNAQIAAQLNAAQAQGAGGIQQANLQRQSALDQMLLGHQLGGLDDYRRTMLGIEDREDTQSFQGGQADIDRMLAERQFWGHQSPLQWSLFGLDQGRLGLANRQLDANIYQGVYAPYMATQAQIYGNPNLTAEQQTAASQNFGTMMPGFAQQVWGSIPPGLFSPSAFQVAQGMPPMGPMDFGGW